MLAPNLSSYDQISLKACWLATPAEHALDDEPTGSNSKQVANQVTHDDDGVERAYDEIDVITNGLRPDRDDLSLDLGMPRPPLDSPRMKETSQRSTVPDYQLVLSTIRLLPETSQY